MKNIFSEPKKIPQVLSIRFSSMRQRVPFNGQKEE